MIESVRIPSKRFGIIFCVSLVCRDEKSDSLKMHIHQTKFPELGSKFPGYSNADNFRSNQPEENFKEESKFHQSVTLQMLYSLEHDYSHFDKLEIVIFVKSFQSKF